MVLSRRGFMGGAAALAASAVLPEIALGGAGKPNSKFNGVQIGVITYSFRGMPSSAEDLLGYCLKCGISSVELMGGPAEGYARKAGGSDVIAGFKALRKFYNDAGVNIHIVKFDNIGNKGVPDEQIEYYFEAAKAAGAIGITREISDEAAKRLGPMADKHKIWIGFHNHTQLTPTLYDGPILSYGKYLGINLDIGHYVAGSNHSPLPLIEKHHERIVSLHLKDRKVNNGPNMPFGEGDTPVALVLQQLRRNKYTFPADIELEYRVPEGSDAAAEVARCVQFCKTALA
jgi:sugar phosphate isomerase/epimerase